MMTCEIVEGLDDLTCMRVEWITTFAGVDGVLENIGGGLVMLMMGSS